MRSLGAAIAFLTRIPMPAAAYRTDDVGKSARWFPLAGALLGGIYAAMLHLLSPTLPPFVLAACLGWFCFRRIGGVTGDTLSSNVQISKCAVLLIGVSV